MRLPRIFYNILFLPLFAFGSLETDVEQIKSYTFSIYNKQTSIDSGVRSIMNDVDAISDRFVQETTARTSFRSNVESSLTSIDTKLTNLASPNDYSSQFNKILSLMGNSAYTSSQDLSLFKFLFGSQYYVPSNNSLYRGGVYGMISDILQELKNQNASPNITITNSVNPVFSITNIVNSPSIVITNDVNPIFNITNDVNPSFSITNNVNNSIVVSNFVNIVSTNQVAGEPIDYATLLANLGLYTSLSTVEKSYSEILGVVSNRPYTVDLSPYYYASSGLWFTLLTTRGEGLRFKNYLSGKVNNSGSYDISILLSNISDYSRKIDNTPSDSTNVDDSNIFDSFAYQSFLVNEMLFGTADIENMMISVTNEFTKLGPRIDNLEVVISNGFETVVMTLYQFTNFLQNVSVSSLVNSNQFADALHESTDIMPASFTDTSISGITNATIYATQDNGYSTLLTENAINENSFDYSRFETSVRSFVQVWQNGVNVGSPTLNIHFAGVDTGEGNPTLEQTIDLDFELPQTAKDKISAFWSAVFALIRGSLILWGFFRLFNAVLNANRRDTSQNDFTNVDID